MREINLDKSFLILISIIPLTIIIGPSVSLINILLISFLFLVNIIINKNLKFEDKKILFILLSLVIYFIFNSLISLDYKVGMARNFGFIRYVLLFLAINYFFYMSNYKNNFLLFWLLIIFIVVFDSYVESIFGKNILGNVSPYKERIVSFFKDEPIVGGYLNGFLFIATGYLFQKYYDKEFKFKIFIFLLVFILLACIILTGERSNAIKSIFGLLVFFILNQKIDFKNKIISSIIIVGIIFTVIFSSDYLKVRYGNQLFSHFFNKEKTIQFIEGNLYFKLYRSGYEIFKDYPIFGVGNKNYRVVTTNNLENKVNDHYFISTHPHQVYFEFLSEHGIFGSSILLTIFFFLIFKNLKVIILSRNSLQLGCFVFLINNFLPILPSGSFFGDFNSNLFWLNLSLMYACSSKTNIFEKKN